MERGGVFRRFQKVLDSVRLLFFLIHKSRPPNIIEGITHLYIISIQCFLFNAIYNGLLKFQDDIIDDETFLPSSDNEELIEKKKQRKAALKVCALVFIIFIH